MFVLYTELFLFINNISEFIVIKNLNISTCYMNISFIYLFIYIYQVTYNQCNILKVLLLLIITIIVIIIIVTSLNFYYHLLLPFIISVLYYYYY